MTLTDSKHQQVKKKGLIKYVIALVHKKNMSLHFQPEISY